MFRKKVKVAWVESDRTITFQKRKRRILNKVRELTTVCGVNAVVIFRGPHGNKPTVWHSGQVTEESRKLIEHFEPDLDLPSSSFSPYEGEDEEKMMSKIGGFKKRYAWDMNMSNNGNVRGSPRNNGIWLPYDITKT